MTILIDASLYCNLNCKYCYNHPLRETVLKHEKINLKKIKEAVRTLYKNNLSRVVALHGGEPLSWERGLVEELLHFIFDLTGESVIQTNGVLIDEEYIELFKRYRTQIGLSVDGFGRLNRLRTNAETTKRIFKNLELLVDNKIRVGVITLLHKANGLKAYWNEFSDYLEYLSVLKIEGRFNPCVYPSKTIELTNNELTACYKRIFNKLNEFNMTGWSPFKDMINSLLRNNQQVVCSFRPCDPYCTLGGIIVTSNGSIRSCSKFLEQERPFVYPPQFYRIHLLQTIDCKGCKFFYCCWGHCPASAINFDWRNKSRFCDTWKELFRILSTSLSSANLELKGLHPIRPEVYACTQHSDHYDHEQI